MDISWKKSIFLAEEIGREVARSITIPAPEIVYPPEAPVPPTNNEILNTLKKISGNQEIERKRYERSNPIDSDEPIYDWSEATVDPGYMVQFIYTVPEGRVFYFEYPNITHHVDTTYYIWIDGVYQPTISYTIQDFGDHSQVYKPPKMCYNNVQIWALNSGIVPQTYSCFFRGFNRWYEA